MLISPGVHNITEQVENISMHPMSGAQPLDVEIVADDLEPLQDMTAAKSTSIDLLR
jgi:hypothetical protein